MALGVRALAGVMATALGGCAHPAAPAPAPPSAWSTTGVIQGIVTDAATGERLAGVTISVRRQPEPSGLDAGGAVTDRDGHYEVANLHPGTYQITARYRRHNAKVHGVGAGAVTPIFFKLAVPPPRDPWSSEPDAMRDGICYL